MYHDGDIGAVEAGVFLSTLHGLVLPVRPVQVVLKHRQCKHVGQLLLQYSTHNTVKSVLKDVVNLSLVLFGVGD